MKIKFERRTRSLNVSTGWFTSKKYTMFDIFLTVVPTEEEVAVIKKANFGDYMIVDAPPEPGMKEKDLEKYIRQNKGLRTVGEVIHYNNTRIASYTDALKANEAELEIKQNLETLKHNIDGYLAGTSTDEFEL